CACVEHCIDAAFAVVAHQQSAKLKSSIYKSVLRVTPDFHFIECVLKIRSIRVCSKVAPFADHGTSHEAIVRLITVGKQNGVAYFVPILAVRSDGRVAAHLSAHVNVTSFAQRERTAYHGTFVNYAVLTEINRTVLRIDDGCFHGNAFFRKKIVFTVYDSVLVSDTRRLSSCSEQPEVFSYLRPILSEYLPW